MTQIFREDGRVVPVTVIEAGPCVVTQIKTRETDGYEAVQLGFGEVKRLNQPKAGHLKASQQRRYLREVKATDVSEFEVGQNLGVDLFEEGEILDVIGKSKGRGFAGAMKRWGFHGGPRTHGQSDRARAPGSIGGGTTPGKVYKGMKMAGHMGDKFRTIQNLEIIKSDLDNNLIFIKGSVPGSKNSLIFIQKNKKKINKKTTSEKNKSQLFESTKTEIIAKEKKKKEPKKESAAPKIEKKEVKK